MKLRIVKRYSNYSGRKFIRFAIVGQPETLDTIADVCVATRDGSVNLTTDEARDIALERLDAATLYRLVCPMFRGEPQSLARAKKRLADTVELGACTEQHTIEPVHHKQRSIA